MIGQRHFFRDWFVNAWLVGIGAPTQLVWVEPVVLRSSAFGGPPLLPARRCAAGGEKRGIYLRAAVVHNHALHPDKVGGGVTPSIVATSPFMTDEVALSN